MSKLMYLSIYIGLVVTAFSCTTGAVDPSRSLHSMMDKMNKLIPDTSTKELKNNIRVLLADLNIRRIPLAKKNSEHQLADLYKDEKNLIREIADYENKLEKVKVNVGNGELRVLESRPVKGEKPIVEITQLTTAKIQSWEADLTVRKNKLEEVKRKIHEAKLIAKNPENYISVPSLKNLNPEEEQENMKALIINDREMINMRAAIRLGDANLPAWMTDNF